MGLIGVCEKQVILSHPVLLDCCLVSEGKVLNSNGLEQALLLDGREECIKGI